MQEKKFAAILAKNDIARELKVLQKEGENISYIFYSLQRIENFLGVANQPSILSILKSKLDI
jgi:hypothetical protein